MRVIKIFIATLLTVASMFISSPVSAQGAAVGDVWTADAYCLSEDAAVMLSRAMAERGFNGYYSVMVTDGIRCWDARLLNNISSPQVKLLEKQWTVTTLRGQNFDFWVALSQDGTPGWVWFLIEDEVEGSI